MWSSVMTSSAKHVFFCHRICDVCNLLIFIFDIYSQLSYFLIILFLSAFHFILVENTANCGETAPCYRSTVTCLLCWWRHYILGWDFFSALRMHVRLTPQFPSNSSWPCSCPPQMLSKWWRPCVTDCMKWRLDWIASRTTIIWVDVGNIWADDPFQTSLDSRLLTWCSVAGALAAQLCNLSHSTHWLRVRLPTGASIPSRWAAEAVLVPNLGKWGELWQQRHLQKTMCQISMRNTLPLWRVAIGNYGWNESRALVTP